MTSIVPTSQETTSTAGQQALFLKCLENSLAVVLSGVESRSC